MLDLGLGPLELLRVLSRAQGRDLGGRVNRDRTARGVDRVPGRVNGVDEVDGADNRVSRDRLGLNSSSSSNNNSSRKGVLEDQKDEALTIPLPERSRSGEDDGPDTTKL